MMLKPGYYSKPYGGEVYYLSGKKTGNRCYNQDADEPAWETFSAWGWKIILASLEKFNYFDGWTHSKKSPLK